MRRAHPHHRRDDACDPEELPILRVRGPDDRSRRLSDESGRLPIAPSFLAGRLDRRGHKPALGFLDQGRRVRFHRLSVRGVVIRGVPCFEPFRSVVGEDPDEPIPLRDNPSAVDPETEFPSERKDAACPAVHPLRHLAFPDRVHPELRDRFQKIPPHGSGSALTRRASHRSLRRTLPLMDSGSRTADRRWSSPPEARSHQEKAAQTASQVAGPRRAAAPPGGGSDSYRPTAPGKPRRGERGPPTHGPSSSPPTTKNPTNPQVRKQ